MELLESVTGLELYALKTDIGEQHNAVAERPEVVERFMFLAPAAHAELGDYDRIGKRVRFYEYGPRW